MILDAARYSTNTQTWHLVGRDGEGRPAYLCLEGWALDATTEDFISEFERRACTGHVPNVICVACFNPVRYACDKCGHTIGASLDDSDLAPEDLRCPACGQQPYH